MQPLITMVIPCYNKVEYIDKMFESVLRQDYNNIELIIVNDGSTDGTREKIGEWQPVFINRGYRCTIVDQSNQGLGSAVKHGLERMKGEYVCTPDCDDILHDNYVSALKGLLDANASANWVISGIARRNSSLLREATDLLAAYLLELYNYSVGTRLFRASYLKSCHVLENWADSRTIQEPQINIPLFLSGSRPVCTTRKVYRYMSRSHSIMKQARSTEENKKKHWQHYYDLTKEVLLKHKAFNERTDCILKFGLLNKREKDNISIPYEEWLDVSDNYLRLVDFENAINIKSVALPVLKFFMEVAMIGIRPKPADVNLKDYDRVIACAALGRQAKDLLTIFEFLRLRIDALWDINADGDNVAGYTIQKPCYESLSERDLCLIMAINEDAVQDIRRHINKAQILENPDIVLLLAQTISNQYLTHTSDADVGAV